MICKIQITAITILLTIFVTCNCQDGDYYADYEPITNSNTSVDTSAEECGFNTTATLEYQHIHTPNYPNGYAYNTECTWYVNVPQNCHMMFVTNGHVEPGYDYLKIDFGYSVLKLHGRKENSIIDRQVYKGTFKVTFFSDHIYNFAGYDLAFKIEYVFPDEFGTTTLLEEKKTTTTEPPTTTTEPPTTTTEPPTTTTEPPTTTTEPTTTATLPYFFTTQTNLTNSSASCGFYTNLTFEDQYIRTPNYPEKYPESTECKWYINVPEDGQMEYVLRGKAESGFDYLKIDFGNFVEKYSGEEYSIPYTRPIVKGIVEVSFYSDSVFTFKGYQMAFKYNKTEENETTTTTEPYSPTAQANLTEQSSYEGNKTSPNDMIFFPGCSLSSLFDQFWSKCLVGEFLQLKKFDGPKQCQSSWHNMFKCGYLIMNDSLNGYPEWKVEYFPRELLRQFKNIGGFNHYASSYYNGTNTELDIFCYHAPLGLNFPKMSKFSLAQTSDSFCEDDTFSKVAQIFAEGYRGQVWAQYQGDIYEVFQEMTRRVFETIHAECSMRNAQRGFEDFITVLPKLFEKAYETMYADDY